MCAAMSQARWGVQTVLCEDTDPECSQVLDNPLLVTVVAGDNLRKYRLRSQTNVGLNLHFPITSRVTLEKSQPPQGSVPSSVKWGNNTFHPGFL